jgi:hypothetical protein
MAAGGNISRLCSRETERGEVEGAAVTGEVSPAAAAASAAAAAEFRLRPVSPPPALRQSVLLTV